MTDRVTRWAHDFTKTGPAQDRAKTALGKTAVILAGVWLVGLSLGTVGDREIFESRVLGLVLLGALLGVWSAWALGRLPDRGYLWAMCVIGVLQIFNVRYVDDVVWIPTTLLTLVAVSIGLLIPPPGAVRAVILLAVVSALARATALAWEQAPQDQWGSALIRVVYLLSAGMIAAATARLFLAVARREDRGAAARIANSVRRAELAQDNADRLRIARVVHDTVINTLGLLGGGIGVERIPALRARCRDDLVRIDSDRSPDSQQQPQLTFPGSDLAEALAEVVETRAGDSVVLAVDDRGSTRPRTLPKEVIEAFCATVTEALNNAAKHAPAADVTVRATIAEDPDGAGVTVRIADDGPGIQDAGVRRGLAAKYRDTYAGPGGLTTTLASGDVGTTVTVKWTPGKWTPRDPVASAGDAAFSTGQAVMASAVTPTVVQMVGWLSLMSLVRMLVAVWQDATPTSVVVQGLVEIAVVGILCSVAAFAAQRHWPVPGLVVYPLLVAIPLLTIFPGLGTPGCGGPALGRWGPDAALLVLALVILLANSLWWAAIGAGLFGASTVLVVALTGPQPVSCLLWATPGLVMNTAVLVALAYFRVKIQRSTAAATADYRDAQGQRVAAATEAVHAYVQATYLRGDISACRPLVASLASGEVDPRDPEVVAEAAADEAYLRTMIALADAVPTSPLAAELAGVAATAREARMALTVSIAGVPEPSEEVRQWLGSSLGLVVKLGGTTGDAALYREEPGGQLCFNRPVGALAGAGIQRVLTGAGSAAAPAGATLEAGIFAGWLSITFGWPRA